MPTGDEDSDSRAVSLRSCITCLRSYTGRDADQDCDIVPRRDSYIDARSIGVRSNGAKSCLYSNVIPVSSNRGHADSHCRHHAHAAHCHSHSGGEPNRTSCHCYSRVPHSHGTACNCNVRARHCNARARHADRAACNRYASTRYTHGTACHRNPRARHVDTASPYKYSGTAFANSSRFNARSAVTLTHFATYIRGWATGQ